jgi:hypothetical protein
MKLDYRRFLVELDGQPASEIFRPIVPILIRGPRTSVLLRPLLDCGADFTLLPISVATLVGIELNHDRTGIVGGIEGGSLTTTPGEAELELTDGRKTFRWQSTVRFAEGNNMLLGHLGFLEFFTATLNHCHRTFSLEPNERYPGKVLS